MADVPIQFRDNHARDDDNARPLHPFNIRNKLLNHHEIIQQNVRVDYDRDSGYRVRLGWWRRGWGSESTGVVVLTGVLLWLRLRLGVGLSIIIAVRGVSAVSRNTVMLFVGIPIGTQEWA